jgi:excisionase family DNA binding protein
VSEKLVISPVQQDEDERVGAVRKSLLAARDAGAVVTLTAEPVFLSLEEAGELIGVSRNTIIRRIDAGEIHGVPVGTHRRIPLGAFEAYRRTLPQQWRWQRCLHR